MGNFVWRSINRQERELERLQAEVTTLTAQLYSTQCRDCAGQGMPTKAALYCNHCGEAFVRMMPNAVPEREQMTQPYIAHCEDGSTIIEWVLGDARFYISLEPDVAESSWGYVTQSGIGQLYGVLPHAVVDAIAKVRGEE